MIERDVDERLNRGPETGSGGTAQSRRVPEVDPSSTGDGERIDPRARFFESRDTSTPYCSRWGW